MSLEWVRARARENEARLRKALESSNLHGVADRETVTLKVSVGNRAGPARQKARVLQFKRTGREKGQRGHGELRRP